MKRNLQLNYLMNVVDWRITPLLIFSQKQQAKMRHFAVLITRCHGLGKAVVTWLKAMDEAGSIAFTFV